MSGDGGDVKMAGYVPGPIAVAIDELPGLEDQVKELLGLNPWNALEREAYSIAGPQYLHRWWWTKDLQRLLPLNVASISVFGPRLLAMRLKFSRKAIDEGVLFVPLLDAHTERPVGWMLWAGINPSRNVPMWLNTAHFGHQTYRPMEHRCFYGHSTRSPNVHAPGLYDINYTCPTCEGSGRQLNKPVVFQKGQIDDEGLIELGESQELKSPLLPRESVCGFCHGLGKDPRRYAFALRACLLTTKETS